MGDFRSTVSPEDRALDLVMRIDPGFVNHRLAAAILGTKGMEIVDYNTERLPADLPPPLRQVRIDNLIADILLKSCEVTGVPTLRAALSEPRGGIVVIAATEELGPCPDIFEAERGRNQIKLEGFDGIDAVLEYSVANVWSDTSKFELNKGCTRAFVGTLEWSDERSVIVRPAVMGPPWVDTQTPDPDMRWPWYSYDYFEHFIEDIDEFSAVRDEPTPDSVDELEAISERAFKTCLGEILGDNVVADWGGEQADHYSAHVRVAGKRHTAAFLLKGPARFQPMTLNSLGKNNDQICRLTQTPASLLVVQHCHDIAPAVRQTLRAFAVQPGAPRRYMLIDGRDSLRLLRAYGKVQHALELSEQERQLRGGGRG